MTDFVASKDLKNKQVTFADRHSGEDAFKDLGDKLVMSKRSPELEHVAAALTLASEKFGKLKINGSAEFKQQVIDVAIAKNLNVVFDSPKMQADFIEQKEVHIAQKEVSVANVESQTIVNNELVNSTKNNVVNKSQSQSNDTNDLLTVPNKPILQSFGSAPYLHDEKNAQSFHVTLNDGQTLWGAGLKDALENSGAKVGDQIDVERQGTKKVTIIKNDLGEVVSHKEKEVDRVIWNVAVVQSHQSLPVSDTYQTKYNWDAVEQKMEVSINGQQPNSIPESTLEKIIANDKFLSKFSLDAIQSGKLDLGASAGIQPVPKMYSEHGQKIEMQQSLQTAKLTQ